MEGLIDLIARVGFALPFCIACLVSHRFESPLGCSKMLPAQIVSALSGPRAEIVKSNEPFCRVCGLLGCSRGNSFGRLLLYFRARVACFVACRWAPGLASGYRGLLFEG